MNCVTWWTVSLETTFSVSRFEKKECKLYLQTDFGAALHRLHAGASVNQMNAQSDSVTVRTTLPIKILSKCTKYSPTEDISMSSFLCNYARSSLKAGDDSVGG